MSTLLQPLMLLEQWILEGLHAIGLTWGFAIVALTLMVRLALLPLALRQVGVRRRLAAHAPQLRALRDRQRDVVVKQQAELAAYRKQHGLRPRGALAGGVFQILVVISLALLLRSDAAAGTFGDASWLFVSDLSEPAAGVALAVLLGGWLAVQVASLGFAARAGRRRLAIALLAPIPLLFAASQIPAGILVYLLVSSLFGLGLRVTLRLRAPGSAPTVVTA